MKTSITLLILLGAWIGVIAQAPEAISYQAVARDNSGNLITNQPVSFRLSILYGTPGGPVVYSESHISTTNDYGLATLQVGNGTVISGVFSTIDWSLGYYYLKTEMDPAGGSSYLLMGTSQFLSVPYALYAKTAGSGGSSLPSGTAGQTLRNDGSDWISTSSLFNNGTNIGIGTTTPLYRLEVGDDASINNIRIGKGAGTATRNTALGENALTLNTNSSDNTAAGFNALSANTSGNGNTALGSYSLNNNTSGTANVAMGYLAMNSNVSNSRSTALGYYAMRFADNRIAGRQTYNTAVGYEALRGSSIAANNTGQDNTAVGDQALFLNSSGSSNTAYGSLSMSSTSTGYSNTAAGFSSLSENTSGYHNTALGTGAGITLSTGYQNTLVGSTADVSSSALFNSTAVGYGAITDDNNQVRLGNSNITSFYCQGAYASTTTSAPNIYVTNSGQIMRSTATIPTGAGSAGKVAYWDGTSNLNYNTQFHWDNMNGRLGIGTTNPGYKLVVSEDVAFSSVRVGRGNGGLTYNTVCGSQALSAITSGNYNVAVGYAALNLCSTGGSNAAFGSYALEENTTGYRNSALGRDALTENTIGYDNLSLGYSSLLFNNDGNENVAVGNNSLVENEGNSGSTAVGFSAMRYADSRTTGRYTYNTAVGYKALYGSSTPINNSGRYNTTVGSNAMESNTSGSYNTGLGAFALGDNTEGAYNVAVGFGALQYSDLGNVNTAVGQQALAWISSGSNNVGVGFMVGFNLNAGNYNTLIGNRADVSSGSISNSTALGSNATAEASNQIRLGNSDITSLYCQGAYAGTVGTTNRDLFADNTGKIGYVSSSLRYKDNITGVDDISWLYQLKPVNFTYKTDPGKTRQYGLIAEEVEKVIPQLVSYNDDGLPETISYSSLITPMLKALQEQNNEISAQKIEIKEQKVLIEKLIKEIQEIRGQR